MYKEDKLLKQYEKEHNLSFSLNVFKRHEQRHERLDKLASWRVVCVHQYYRCIFTHDEKPKSALEQSIEMYNKEIIDSTRGYTYKSSNSIVKQQIHQLLLRSLHKAQLESVEASKGWSLRNAHK